MMTFKVMITFNVIYCKNIYQEYVRNFFYNKFGSLDWKFGFGNLDWIHRNSK